MNHCPYRFLVDIKPREGGAITLPFQVDFDAAVRWAHFQAIRQGSAAPSVPATSAIIEPTWHPQLGEPHVVGFKVNLSDRGGTGSPAARGSTPEDLSFHIPLVYFRRSVEEMATGLVEEGKLEPGESFLYEVSAFRAEPPEPGSVPSDVGRFVASDVPQELPLVQGDMNRLIAGARLQGADHRSALDTPTFIPERAIDDAKRQALAAGDVECGGVLIGRLHRDTRSSEIFAAVTAFIPAPHTLAERSRLTFTAETWAAVGATIELRASDEMLLGFLHYHPFFCRNCPLERRRVCSFNRPFFSQDDVTLQHTVFPAPFHIAMLLTDLGGDDLIVTAYGWRYGMVMRRAYYVLPEMESTDSSPNPEAITHAEVQR